MSGFIQYVIIGCISFTASSTFYLLFSFLTIFPPFNDQMMIHMIIINFSIMFLMFVKNSLPIYHPAALRCIEIFNVVLVLLVAGAIFNVFPFTWYYVLMVTLSGLLTYAVVMIVSYIGNMLTSREINSIIAGKKRRESNEKYN